MYCYTHTAEIYELALLALHTNRSKHSLTPTLLAAPMSSSSHPRHDASTLGCLSLVVGMVLLQPLAALKLTFAWARRSLPRPQASANPEEGGIEPVASEETQAQPLSLTLDIHPTPLDNSSSGHGS